MLVISSRCAVGLFGYLSWAAISSGGQCEVLSQSGLHLPSMSLIIRRELFSGLGFVLSFGWCDNALSAIPFPF